MTTKRQWDKLRRLNNWHALKPELKASHLHSWCKGVLVVKAEKPEQFPLVRWSKLK